MDNNTNQQCHEVVIYRIQQDALSRIGALQRDVRNTLTGLDGFVSIETEVAIDDPRTFIDRVLWRDAGAAKAAFEAFSALPCAAAFMAALDGEPVFAGHFQAHT